jgi:pimeloyl-ACP methyl ester carboxylesterase
MLQKGFAVSEHHNPHDPAIQYLLLGQQRYAYRIAGTGNGPAIVLLHGMGESSRVFWRTLFDHFSDRYTLIAPDISGFGNSDDPPNGYTPAAEAGNIAALLDHLNITETIILGHSLGGIIATKFALLYPNTVSRLIIYSTPIPGALHDNLAIALEMPWEGVALMGLLAMPGVGWLLHQQRSQPLVRLLATSMHVTRNPADYTDEMVQEGLYNSYDAVTKWVQQGFLFENLMQDLPHIATPTLLLRGQYDAVSSRCMERAAAALPHAQTVTIAGAAHTALAEQPTRFLAAIEHFLVEEQQAERIRSTVPQL